MHPFIARCFAGNVNNSCFASTTLQAPGEVTHNQPQGWVLLVTFLHMDYVYVVGPMLVFVAGHPGLYSRFLDVAFSCPQSYSACASCLKRCPWPGPTWTVNLLLNKAKLSFSIWNNLLVRKNNWMCYDIPSHSMEGPGSAAFIQLGTYMQKLMCMGTLIL